MMKQPAASAASGSSKLTSLVLLYAGSLAVTLLVTRLLLKRDEHDENERDAGNARERRLRGLLAKRKNAGREATVVREGKRRLSLNHHEKIMAGDVVDPRNIPTRFRDVGGIDDVKAEIWELAVLPLRRPELFRSASGLVGPPRGILLYGAPGTGKTMLARAVARESGATFLNLRLSSILNMYLGESNKLVAAAFSLAEKLAPSILFIDEIDTFLRQRGGGGNEASLGSIKAEFLTLLDGMLTERVGSHRPVLVLAATNRPYDVDAAILRRLPRTFEIGLPSADGRLAILNLLLEKQPMTRAAREFLPELSRDRLTAGYSGSDLKELCRAAALGPVREVAALSSYAAVTGAAGGESSASTIPGPPLGEKIRLVDVKDFEEALRRVKRTGEAAEAYREKDVKSGGVVDERSLQMAEVARGLIALQNLFDTSSLR